MKLQISSNERPYKEIIKGVKSLYPNPDSYEVTNIDMGDLQKGNAVIELKSASDLIKSMKKEDGATIPLILRQAINMQQFSRPLILVTATIPEIILESRLHMNPKIISEGNNKGFPIKSLFGYMASIYARTGVPIIPWGNFGADYYAYSLLEKSNDGKILNFNPLKASASPIHEQEAIISSIIDIGPEISKKLLTHFKTVKNIFNATPEQLMEVEKIGPKTAKRIYEISRRNYENGVEK